MDVSIEKFTERLNDLVKLAKRRKISLCRRRLLIILKI